ncbi:MAG TPA: ABC transporter ATP-binding protein [Treponemataceae bacterium]|jgi:lipoprotein-releasing system ATP-binding protein|nr:ABC transporter ATP-binding protein [Treponemataceae bacterium]
MNESDSSVLTIQGLEKTYRDAVSGESLTIIKDLDMKVPVKSKIVILGESGCGKSTLLNIIGGLDSATGGFIQCGKYTITAMDEENLTEFRSRYLGLIFQFHYLLKDFSALENVFLPAYMAGLPKKQAMDRAVTLLNDVGLSHRLHHIPSQLSGGERQRTAVARALVNDPQIILADEPTGNLDPSNSGVISSLLFSMVEKYGKTLLLVTHDHDLASQSDAAYKLHGGKLELL